MDGDRVLRSGRHPATAGVQSGVRTEDEEGDWIPAFAGEEFRAAIQGGISAPPVAQDESVSVAAEVSKESTRDFVLKTLAQELKGHPFAAFVAHLLEKMGYHTRLSPPGPDSGIDIVAHYEELDSRYKSVLPLRRVYIPQRIEEPSADGRAQKDLKARPMRAFLTHIPRSTSAGRVKPAKAGPGRFWITARTETGGGYFHELRLETR